ncbi:HEAT repeat domain-containing protein [candidate division CSSED10-310 bacterium]|uniref:HEAT repeat domain-containing protein n=1 Tax=candidate division CSSED10-310 bacterium TaxID=2855610 RepID=A0ABV6YZE8_UNCC1
MKFNQNDFDCRLLQNLHNPVKIVINAASSYYQDVKRIMAMVSENCRHVLITEETADGDDLFYFTICDTDKGRVKYLALPVEMEWEPFLQTLVAFSEGSGSRPTHHIPLSSSLPQSVELLIAISPFCPHCAEMVVLVNSLAAANRHISTVVVDVSLEVAFLAQYNIQSSPTIIINGHKAFVGQTDLASLVDYISSGGEAQFKKRIMTLIEEREEGQALQEILAHPTGPALLGSLVASPALSTRLGILALFEDLEDLDSLKAREAVPTLLELINHQEIPIKCDVIMTLGILKDERALEALRPLLGHPDEDVAEGAAEAIDDIESAQDE